MEIFRIKGLLATSECDECIHLFEEVYGPTDKITKPIERLKVEDVKDRAGIDAIVAKHTAIALKVNDVFNFDIESARDSSHTIHGYRKGYRGVPHIDNRTPYERVKIVVVTLLSDPSSFSGGELDFFGVAEDQDALKINKGDTIAFPAYMTHTVELLENGTRHSFVSMFKGQFPFR